MVCLCTRQHKFTNGISRVRNLFFSHPIGGFGEVTYYLPAGQWKHYFSGVWLDGGRWITEKVDYFTIPLWEREIYNATVVS